MFFKSKLVFNLLIFSLSIGLIACGNDTTRVSRLLLGTEVTITIADNREDIAEVFNKAFSEIEKIQKRFSLTDAESEISCINNSAFLKPFICSDDVYSLVKQTIYISEKTSGAFDITWASTGKLWDFSGEQFTPPDDKTIRELLPLISYKNIFLNDSKRTLRFLKKGTKIGLGGVAKGYAVQKAVSALKEMGVKGAIVACAGDIQVIGDNHHKPWKGGIKDPRGESVIATFYMDDGDSVSTSGDYERYRIFNGRRYHHIIDPLSGYPAESGLVSVTVFSRDPVISDAYSTAFFVSGIYKTKRILGSMSNVSTVLVDTDLKVYASSDLKGRVRFREDLNVTYF